MEDKQIRRINTDDIKNIVFDVGYTRSKEDALENMSLDELEATKTTENETDAVNSLNICPFCEKVVGTDVSFITEPSGQKCHLHCYMDADY